MKSFSDNLACVRNQNECSRLLLLNKITKLNSLLAVQRSKNNIAVFTGKCALSIHNRCTSHQIMCDEVTNGFGMAAYNIEIF